MYYLLPATDSKHTILFQNYAYKLKKIGSSFKSNLTVGVFASFLPACKPTNFLGLFDRASSS